MKQLSARQKKMIKVLRDTHIIKTACDRVGISRQTHYRWVKENKEYAKQVDESIAEGVALINDMAETQLISKIQNGNTFTIRYWLDNNHDRFKKQKHPTFHDFIHNLPKQIREDTSLSLEKQEEILRGLKAWSDWDHQRKNDD